MWDICQMLNIWHISHTKQKNSSLSDIAYVVKLYHLCPYRCKFATVRTDVVNQKLLFYLTFLSPLISLFDFLSPFSESVSLSPKFPTRSSSSHNRTRTRRRRRRRPREEKRKPRLCRNQWRRRRCRIRRTERI